MMFIITCCLRTSSQVSIHPQGAQSAPVHDSPGESQGPKAPPAQQLWGVGIEGPHSHHILMPPSLGTLRTITTDKPAAVVWGEQVEIPWVPQGASATAGPSLSLQQVTNQCSQMLGRCHSRVRSRGKGLGDLFVHGVQPVAPAEPCARLQWAGGQCPHLPCARGLLASCPTIINPVKLWQLWLSLIDRVRAEVLGHAGPTASPTPSVVLGKQAAGTAPCCRAGWHQRQGLAPDLPWPWGGSVEYGKAGGTLLCGKAPSGFSGG